MADPNALILKMSADISGMQKQISAAVGIVDSGSAKMVLRSKEAAAAIEKSFGSVTVDSFKASLSEVAALQDRLTAAQAAGNAEEAKALKAELALRGAVQKAAVAQLETQLAIAKAAGSKGQVAQLTETLALQSQISKFQGVGLTGAKALHEAEAAVVAIGAAEKAAEGANVGKALDKVFDSSKLALVEEGSAKLRVFGSAVEPLGPYGIAAAVGVAALAAAAEEARKAMEWADELDRTAKKLGTTTDQLQKFDYASISLSIGIDQGREALASFNTMVGKFETHIGDAKIVKWATAIHLSRDEVNKTVDPVEKLALVMEKIATLRDAQSRAAAAKAFGLEGLLPIINSGKEGIEEFIGKMKEAQSAGGVVSAQDIKQAAEMNDKVEALSYLISQHLHEAFIGLAPAILSVAEFIERCSKALGDFLGEIPQAISGIKDLANAIPEIPHIPGTPSVGDAAKAAAGNSGKAAFPVLSPILDIIPIAARELARQGRAANLRDQVKDMLSGKPIDLAGTEWDPALKNQKTGQQLAFDTPKHGPADTTLSNDKAAQDAYDNSVRALAAAQLALVGDLQERAALEKKAVDQDLEKKLQDLGFQEEKIRREKNDSHKKEQIALLEKAKTEEANAAKAKKELIDRNLLVSNIQQAATEAAAASQSRAAALEAEQRHDSALATLALTVADRNRFEQASLAAAQKREDELAQAQVDRALAELAVATATGKTADIINAQNAVSAALQSQADLGRTHADQAATQAKDQESPFQKYFDSIKDIDTEVQTIGVHAFDSLADGLADAIVNAHSLGDVAKNVFRQMIADLLAAQIKKAGASLLTAFIPGFASGTDFAPGGLALVGERGKELVNLPRGASVTPHLQTLDALNRMRVPSSYRAGDVHLNVNVLASGAIPREEIEGMVRRGSLQAVQAARKLAGADARQRQYHEVLNS